MTIERSGYLLFVAIARLVVAAAMAVFVAATASATAWWFVLGASAIMIGLAVFSIAELRCRADADSDGITVRNQFGTHRVSWSDVTSVEIQTDRIPAYRTLICLRLRMQPYLPIIASARFESGTSVFTARPSDLATQRDNLDALRALSTQPIDATDVATDP